MATDLTPGEKFGMLSLTGHLSLQEKNSRKNRKGKITFKKKSSHWFWFDEKECCLKYYKNSETYYTHLHKYEGLIDLKSAKVSPSEVYQDSVGSVSIDPDIVSNKTFIIITNDGNMYALTADKDDVCHKWIKKLQEKRATWDKNSARLKPSTQKEEFLNMKEEGLVNCTGTADTRASVHILSITDTRIQTSRSHVQTIFENILGLDDPLQRRDSCPNTLPIQMSKAHPYSGTYSRASSSPLSDYISPVTPSSNYNVLQSPNDDLTDGQSRKDRTASSDSITSLGGHSYDESPSKTLTGTERELLRMQVELSEAHQECERLQQKIALLEDTQQKQYSQKMELINEIQDLLETVHKLKATTPVKDLQNENENLKDVIKKLKRSLGSVDGEVELYKAQLEERDKRMQEGNKRLRELEDSLLYYKAKYVSLLDWSFKIPTPGPGGSSSDDPDPIEEKLKEDLINLINQESTVDNPLVDILSSDQSIFEDQFGELHDWNSDSNICHFLCRQLYLHYTQYDQDLTTQEWYNYTKSLKLTKDGYWEIPSESHRTKRRELRGYLRKGVPQPMRSTMWASIVYSCVGKMRDVMNSTAPGKNYYQSLLQTPSLYQKQILLDLYRTMPSNKHYKMDGAGAKKLERVLLAYSNHNKNVGYCQGMNMIAAAGLLFLDEESAFWYLVTVLEKLMPQHYYTTGLAAAQADQAVMKTLVEEKLPNLSNHFEENGIDATIVTFNWFLTLFIDALPTESILRVMDCFLLEGRKIFFRFSLAILKIHELRILRLSDPVTIFQFVKEVAKHIFDVEELFKIAFTKLEPFPSRSTIQSRIKPHLDRFLADWKERESFKKSLSPVPVNVAPPKQKKHLLWECGAIVDSNEVWLCCGERQTGKICIVKSVEDSIEINSPNINVGSKILCIRVLTDDVVMIGTLDFFIHAFCTKSRKELWSMKMNDSVLDFVCYENNIICALADGYIAAIATSTPQSPPTVDSVLYRIGNTAVQCMAISPFNHVWVGCGKAITILEAKTYEPVQAIVLPDKAGKVYKMEQSDHGIWVSFKTSTSLYLYDYRHMVQILAVDYMSLLPTKTDTKLHLSSIDNRVTAMMIFKDIVWVGTGDASFHVFKLSSTIDMPEEQARHIAKLKQRSIERETSQHCVLPKGDLKNDEGLVNERQRQMSSVMRASKGELQQTSKRQQEKQGEIDNEADGSSRLRRREFGKTFYRRIRKDATNLDLKRDEMYQLGHLWSGHLNHDEKDCPKVTTIKPIILQNDRWVVISCLNTTAKFDKAVQLWKCDSKESPHNWSCRFLCDCYSVVLKERSQMPRPPTIDTRRRTYSSFLGSFTPSDSGQLSQTLPETIMEQSTNI